MEIPAQSEFRCSGRGEAEGTFGRVRLGMETFGRRSLGSRCSLSFACQARGYDVRKLSGTSGKTGRRKRALSFT